MKEIDTETRDADLLAIKRDIALLKARLDLIERSIDTVPDADVQVDVVENLAKAAESGIRLILDRLLQKRKVVQ